MAPPGRRRPLVVLSLVCLSFLLIHTASAASAVLGIDLGTEYIKAALVKPGIPLEIVPTKDSRRKETAAVGFKPSANHQGDGFPERVYGSDAVALAARFPAHIYPNLKPLLAARFDASEVTEEYQRRHPVLAVVADKSRSTVAFKSEAVSKEQEPFRVEELLAMELQNVKANAEALAGKGSTIRDAVVTIPAFYTAEERRAVELAAELAGLRVLALISDGLAVGLNYATSRTFPDVSADGKPETHLVFDMGAGSTTATVLRFQGRTVKDVGRFNKTIQEVNVLGTGWDRSLGGDAMNGLLVDKMIDAFVASSKAKSAGVQAGAVNSHGRAAAKLWKEAERIRQVLSANTETMASFEGLYEDVDFRYKLTRADFEEATSDFAKRIDAPIRQALAMAKLSMDAIDSVIMHGGASRTPFVQRQLESLVGDEAKVRSNVNADEAAVFGAAFKGAGLSPSFRVKEIRTGEVAGYPVGLQWTAEGKERQQKLFLPTSYTNTEKLVPFQNQKDFAFTMYQTLPSVETADTNTPVIRIETQNLTSSVRELTDKYGCSTADITTTFAIRLTASDALPEIVRGFVSCEVEATEKKGGVVDDLKGMFGFGSKKDDQEPLNEGSSDPASSETAAKDATPASGSASESQITPEASPVTSKEPKMKLQKINLEFKTQREGIPEISATEIKGIRERLQAFHASDKSRLQREEALNSLEGFTYRARDLVTEESFIEASSADERTRLESALQLASDWLYGDGASAGRDELKARLKELKDLVAPVEKRRQEAVKRPQEIKLMKEALEQSKTLVSMIKAQAEEAASKSSATPTSKPTEDGPATTSSASDDLDDLDDFSSSTTTTASTSSAPKMPIYTMEDVKSIEKIYETIQEWFTTKLAEQEKLLPLDDPVLLSKDIAAKTKQLNDVAMNLLQKKMRVPPKPKASSKPKTAKAGKGKGSSTASGEDGSASKSKPTIRIDDPENGPTEAEISAAIEMAKKKVKSDQKTMSRDEL
ncbi:MAG: lumenal Hsp70 protein [Caeruleum heppii]|nr:MAG: lumenal Hsp70 protein [Caeruleum heppii]